MGILKAILSNAISDSTYIIQQVERELLRNKQNLNSIYSNVGLAGIKPDADVIVDAAL